MSIEKLLGEVGDESEARKDDTYDTNIPVERPNAREARVLSVRFSRAEFADLSARAEVEGLPVSTMARVLVTRGLAEDGIESALRAVIKPEFLREAS